MSNFFQDIAREIGVLVRHNKNTLKTISVAVSADASTLEAALTQIVNTFLEARGLAAVEPIVDPLVVALLGQIEQAMVAQATKVAS